MKSSSSDDEDPNIIACRSGASSSDDESSYCVGGSGIGSDLSTSASEASDEVFLCFLLFLAGFFFVSAFFLFHVAIYKNQNN